MTQRDIGPTSHRYMSNRLRVHYVDWGNDDAPTLLLVHGGRDHCRSWDWVARALCDDYHIIAPDLRGHGDSDWVRGAGYAMIDYVSDVAQLIHQKRLAPLRIIGHSLGGNITLQYAGLEPQDVSRVISIEGLGPTESMIRARASRPPEERLRGWIRSQRQLAAGVPRSYPTLDEAIERMREANPHLSLEQARHLTIHGTDQNEDGSYRWKFDNYVRGGSPYLFNSEEARTLWKRITAPVMLVVGEESWAGDPSQDGRAQHFRNVEVVKVPKAGHWVHHDQLEEFLAHARRFLA
jgi:pimeloyl-ACP methyl ester carboxylesterase